MLQEKEFPEQFYVFITRPKDNLTQEVDTLIKL